MTDPFQSPPGPTGEAVAGSGAVRENDLFVTRPFLPPLEEFVPLLKQIWERGILTNQGPAHMELEAALCRFLGVQHLSLLSNGTLALQLAIKAAKLSGEVITTPYSFVATAHAIVMENLRPVFVDISRDSLNIDPAAIEAAITARTTAILPVHCYGNPCDVDAIQAIADRYGLKVIYDAAHAFGVQHRGRSILEHGDFSTLSFHATKVFSTFEGGAVIAASEAGRSTINLLRNFGIENEVTVSAVGTNAKLNEVSSAFGLLQLKWFSQVRSERKRIDAAYRRLLAGTTGIDTLPLPPDTEPNYSYFPILIGDGYPLSRDQIYERLKSARIHARRYFYPLLSNLPMYRELPSPPPALLPNATWVAERILCLPIYPDLSAADQARIIDVITAPG